MHKTPAQADVQRCLQWLEAELRAVAPSTVVALGRTALGAIERLAEFVPATAMSHPTDLSTVAAQRSTQRGRWRAAVVDAVALPPRFFAPAQSRVPRVTSGGGRHCVWSFSAGPIKHESLHRIFHCTELRDVFLQQREQVSDMRFWPAT